MASIAFMMQGAKVSLGCLKVEHELRISLAHLHKIISTFVVKEVARDSNSSTVTVCAFQAKHLVSSPEGTSKTGTV